MAVLDAAEAVVVVGLLREAQAAMVAVAQFLFGVGNLNQLNDERD